MTGPAIGALCVSSTPWSMLRPPSWISAQPPTSAGGRRARSGSSPKRERELPHVRILVATGMASVIPIPERKGAAVSSGPEAAIKGIVEDVKGKAKEIVGIVVNHEDLRKEGRAQQEKAQAQRDVAKKEAEATAARAAEKAAEARQKSAR